MGRYIGGVENDWVPALQTVKNGVQISMTGCEPEIFGKKGKKDVIGDYQTWIFQC